MGLDAVEVILAIEEEFGISIPGDCLDLSDVVTVRDLAGLVGRCIRDQRKEEPDFNVIVARTVHIVDELSSRRLKKMVVPDTRLQDVLSM